MRPQVTKPAKRTCRKGTVKDLIKKKTKAELDKKRKIVIKKIVATAKQKGGDAKSLLKGKTVKSEKPPPAKPPNPKPRISAKASTSSKQSTSDNSSETVTPKKKIKPRSPEKGKLVDKKSSPALKSPPRASKKIIPNKNAKNQKVEQDRLANKLIRPPKKPVKASTTKEKSEESSSSKTNATAKSAIPKEKDAVKVTAKKPADVIHAIAQPKFIDKDKDRSRSLEKKRLGPTRSSSAPLIPSTGTSDVKDNKPAAAVRTTKASLENLAQITPTNIKSPSIKKAMKTPELKDVSPSPQIKPKEAECKIPTKINQEKTEFKTIKPSPWAADNKTETSIESNTSFLDNQILLSPLGRKKLVGKVKPIARVKGTIIEKKVEVRKNTMSPAKIVEEKPVSEKEISVTEKPKLELDKKKEVISLTKIIEEQKKNQVDKDQSKMPKATKKQDVDKIIPVVSDKNVMVVQPEVIKNSDQIENAPIEAESTVKKTIKVSKVKLITKGSKMGLKRGKPLSNNKLLLIKKCNLGKKVVKEANKTSGSNQSNTRGKKSLEARKKFISSDNKNVAKDVKVGKCKTITVVKNVRVISKVKSKVNIPKKNKTEPKDADKDDVKQQINKSDSVENIDIPPKAVLSEESSVSKDESSQVISDEKAKAKTIQSDRPPSPKASTEKEEGTIKVPEEEVKMEKSEKIASSPLEKSKSIDSVKSEKSGDDKKSKNKPLSKLVKKLITVPTQENIGRKKLLGFWTGPKQHREASLNAQAKVQCLYENESRTHLELGLLRTVDKAYPMKTKEGVKRKAIKVEKESASSESEYESKAKLVESTSSEDDSNPPTRTLRCQPGIRGAGKYWEMKISSSDDSEVEHRRQITEKKKIAIKPKVLVKTEASVKQPVPKPIVTKDKKPGTGTLVKRRRKRNEIVMDLKDMVVKKRMASLNASAILAASYEKRSPRSGRDETTTSDSSSASSEQDEVHSKKFKSPVDKGECSKKDYLNKSEAKPASKSKVEVIVNQESDVTITGVYSHHEGFCTVSGMQYRISATSHTQTTATSSADKPEKDNPRDSATSKVELQPGGSGPGYTPLGALSSMHPPGGGVASHLHQGSIIQELRGPVGGSLGRRAGCSSAFSAPHHHTEPDRSPQSGYYQPAGPLITTTPLHGGFKDGSGPPPLPTDQPGQYGRYPYPQPQQVVHYGGGFGQYGPHAHYGADICYGGGRGPGSGPAPPPSCYRPPPAHRTSAYRPGTGSGPVPSDSQISPTAPEAYAPPYCPPCYQHPHSTSRAPIAFIDAAYQGPCPCPMQSCPKNVHTGPATGNPPAGGGPITSSPPGGSRAPAPILATPIVNYCIDDKRKAKTSNSKDPPLLNQVLKNECSVKNNSELRSGLCQMVDNGTMLNGRSPKREYFPEQVSSRSRQEVNENRGGCCAVAINPSLSVIPPEAHGPPSPARGSAGASIPQPPDPPHPCLNQQPSPLLPHAYPQRRARVGKAMARKSIGAEDNMGQTTMLLMCQPQPVSVELAPPKSVTTPLQVITDPIPSNVSELKSETDSGDEVILLDSPSSKMAPIDLSSSEENNGNDSKNEDCVIIRKEENENVIDLSIETKKENSAVPRKTGSLVSDVNALKEHNVDKTLLNSNNLKKINEAKIKVGTKRRCSLPKLEIDMEVEIDDSLAANGIGEHVKLQKRQKVAANVQSNKKNTAGSYKDLIKKPDKIFKLNNGKKQLNTINKMKSNKNMCLIDSDKQKKPSTKRKSISPLAGEPPSVSKRKKLTNSLLKYTDKKQQRFEELTEKPSENCKKSSTLLPKNKSDSLLETLIMKNIIDPVIENVVKNTTPETTTPPADAPVNIETKPLKKTKKCNEANVDICAVKSRTVLNINNNVVKKANEADCTQVPVVNVEAKSTPEKRARTKSKSPIRKMDKKDATANSVTKGKCQTNSGSDISKDVNAKVSKVENTKLKKSTKNKIGTVVKSAKKKCKASETNETEAVDLPLPMRRLSQPRWSNGWTWEGEPQQGRVYVNNEDTSFWAWCYSGMRHSRAGDSVKRGDCVLLRAGSRRTEAPFVARVTQLWENPTDGEMMVSLLWYYRPEHTEAGRQSEDAAEEVFASRHRDANSVACIEDKCYVLTFNEYCRYRKMARAAEENIVISTSIVPSMPPGEVTPAVATNDRKVPLNISPDLVLFCQRIYDFRLKKIVKPPN